MTNEQIFKQAIKWVINNGLNDEPLEEFCDLISDAHQLSEDEYYSIIFDHGFAKRFFGEKMVCPHCELEGKAYKIDLYDENIYMCTTCERECRRIGTPLPIWQHHLQQMILEEQPLQYIENFFSTMTSGVFETSHNIN